jgi:hypothetical protein
VYDGSLFLLARFLLLKNIFLLRTLLFIFISAIIATIIVPTHTIKASSSCLIGFITWGDINNNWHEGSTLSSEKSLSYLTDIVTGPIKPESVANPVVSAMYGETISKLDTVVTAGHAAGLKVAPYIYGTISTLKSIISEGHLSTMVNSIHNFLIAGKYDGICLDFENGADLVAMDTLIEALYTSLEPHELFIDCAVSAYPSPDISLAAAAKCRYLQVMCYDMGWYPVNIDGYPHASYADTVAGMKMWIDAGYSKSQLVLGIPAYGESSYDTSYKPPQKQIHYHDIVDLIAPSAETDYAELSVDNNKRLFWWGGKNTNIRKADYMIDQGLAGMMMFTIGYDKLNSPYSLLTTIYYALKSTGTPAPTRVSASDGLNTDNVVITWDKSPLATGYKVYRDGTDISGLLGDVDTYTDNTAVAGVLSTGIVSASDGISASYVKLTVTGASAANGTTATYQVKATGIRGDSPYSNNDTGYRGVGSLLFEWYRSTDDTDNTYNRLSGANSSTYQDTTAPIDGSGRYYQVVVSAKGVTPQTSLPDRGYLSLHETPKTNNIKSVLLILIAVMAIILVAIVIILSIKKKKRRTTIT